MPDFHHITCSILDIKKQKVQFKRRPPNKPNVGQQIEGIELDRIVRTDPQDNKHRRTLLLQRRTDTDTWGFTLQSYGLRNKGSRDVDLLTYVDYVAIGGAAHQAGMRQGDVILSIDGESMEEYSHRDLVAYIQQCDTRMRMVVLFENCVRKVELHTRYLKLQRLLTAKEMELRALEAKERKIQSGQFKDKDDPSRLSLAGFSNSEWNDNVSFLSLRPDLDVCPLTPQQRLTSASALSLHYSPSALSVRSESRLPMQNGGSVGNLQLDDVRSLANVGSHRNEYSHSSLPSSVRLKVSDDKGQGRKRSHERPSSMYSTYHPGRRPLKPRPRSLAVSAISEDGDYMDSLSMCGSDMSEASSMNNSVFSANGGGGGYRTSTPFSTPLATPTSPPLLEESGSECDAEYRLPPPGMTPKFLHDHSSSRAASSSASHRSSSSCSSLSLSSSRSSSDRLPPSATAATPSAAPHKTKVKPHKTKVKPKHIPKQYKQPTYAIIEKLQQEPTEPVLLKFKPLKTDFSCGSTAEISNALDFSSEETDSSEESLYSDKKYHNSSGGGGGVHTTTTTHDISWNPCLRDTASSPSGYNLQTSHAFNPHSQSSTPLHETSRYSNDVDNVTSRVLKFALDDENSYGSSGVSSESNGVVSLDADCFLSDDEHTEDEISLGQEIFDSLRDKDARNLNETAAREFPGITLEYVNENDESTDL